MPRIHRGIVVFVLILAVGLMPGAPLAAQQQAADTPLPVQRVVLYKSGIGYFEHLGRVTGDQAVAVSFTSAQLDDVLKTLTVLDLDGGRVTDIGYNSLAPIDQRLRNVRLPVGESPTVFNLLSALRGTPVRISVGAEVLTGRLLSAEKHQRGDNGTSRTVEEISVVTDDGDVRRVEFGGDVTVRLLDEDLRQEMARYLTLLESARDEDVRRLTLSTQGDGTRDLFVSYVSEVPIWKSSYRIVMPSDDADRPILQGWAIVDNTIGEDWENVELSLVGGAPQSFVQQISQPYYAVRPVVPLPDYAQPTPQTHGATLTGGSGRIVGEIRDPDGAPLPGVGVQAISRQGMIAARAFSSVDGTYRLGPMPAGRYRVQYFLDGFIAQTASVTVSGGDEARQDALMELATVRETLTVTGESPLVDRRRSPDAPIPDPAPTASGSWAFPSAERIERGMRAQQAVAGGQALGDLFEYRIDDRVTIRRNQSALVPILRAEVAAEKVALWTQGGGSGQPLRALWLTNESGLSLDGGSFTVIEDAAFAGEGLLDAMEPGERRLLSYGTDVALLVDEEGSTENGAVVRVYIERGVLFREAARHYGTTYTIRNNDATPRTVIVEHPQRSNRELVSEALPVETAPGVYRFRVEAAAGETTILEVAERRVVSAQFALTNVTDDDILLLASQGVSRDGLEDALRPILDQKAEIAAVQAALDARRAEQASIGRDQQRLRQNIQALGSSNEERDLVARYVRQLDEQETRLEELRDEIADRASAVAELQAELRELIETLATEIDVVR